MPGQVCVGIGVLVIDRDHDSDRAEYDGGDPVAPPRRRRPAGCTRTPYSSGANRPGHDGATADV